VRNRYILVGDAICIALAAWAAFVLRFGWLFLDSRPEFLTFLGLALIAKPIVMHAMGMYARYWRYATAKDVLAVALAASACSMVVATMIGIGTFAGVIHDFSRSVVLIDWVLSLLLLGGVRISVRLIGEQRDKARRASGARTVRRVIVAGAGEAGTLVVRELQNNPQLGIVPVAFVDDARTKQTKSISGVRVVGPIEHLPRYVTSLEADEVIIAMPAAGGPAVRRVADICRRAGVRYKTVPGMFEMVGGHITVNRIRDVEITDLLRREHIVDHVADWTADYVRGATVLITGAGGSIGRELARQVAFAQPSLLVLLGHGENSLFEVDCLLREQFPHVPTERVVADIRDEHRIESMFARYAPSVVFHAAAHKHVHLMEENPVEAVSNNVLGTHVVASAAMRHGARRFVLISSDKAVAPTSLMGATKRMAELIVRDLERTTQSTTFVIVRFGNVLGSRGSVVPLFKAQIERGGPVTVTHPEVTRFFMTIPEAVNLVLRAGGSEQGGLFVLDMGAPVRIHDLALDLIRLSGFSPAEIAVEFTGLRPGEKMEEQLWEPETVVEPTSERAIMRLRGEHSSLNGSLDAVLQRFQATVRGGRRIEIEAALADQIPTFVPTHYETTR